MTTFYVSVRLYSEDKPRKGTVTAETEQEGLAKLYRAFPRETVAMVLEFSPDRPRPYGWTDA